MNPPVFQGKLDGRSYFEGWYFKQVSRDQRSVISVIPGISLSKNSHSFIQTINGITGETSYHEFPIDDFRYDRDRFEISIGPNEFSENGFKLDLDRKGDAVKGRIELIGTTPYPGSILSPGIMGWYSYVPFMECYHGVVSMHHRLKGKINVNGKEIDFTDGNGYIEKDWGRSFPESWIWLQSNNFDDQGTSFMLSVAKIPWMGRYFIGFLSFLRIGDEVHRFATYTGAKIKHISFDNDLLKIGISDRKHHINVKAKQLGKGSLKAPMMGEMDRYIKESVDSVVDLEMTDRNGNRLFIGKGTRAGLEVVGEVHKLVRI
ncbi:MAG: tocopherol cyclase family protein [Thermoplasmatota archaeon]